MPTVIVLFGIHIIMNQINKEHGLPHIHAIYGERRGVFTIKDALMIEGNLKNKQQQIVKKFILSYQKELLQMWKQGKIERIKI